MNSDREDELLCTGCPFLVGFLWETLLISKIETCVIGDCLKEILTISLRCYFPFSIPLGCFGIISIYTWILCFMLYKGLVEFSQMGFIVTGTWVYLTYLLTISSLKPMILLGDETKHLKELDSRGETLFQKIKREAEIATYGTYCLLILCFITALTFLPFYGNEEQYYFPVFFFKTFLSPTFSLISQLVFYAVVFHNLLALLYLLNDLISELAERNLGFVKAYTLVDNVDYQRRVGDHLKTCVKQHILVKNFRRTVQNLVYFPFILHSFGGILNSGITLFSLFTGGRPLVLMRLAMSGILTLLPLAISSYYGQKLCDESDRWYTLISNCPWYLWNTENKKMLLLMMLNSREHLTIASSSIVRLDVTYIYRNLKSVYAIAMCLITSFYGK